MADTTEEDPQAHSKVTKLNLKKHFFQPLDLELMLLKLKPCDPSPCCSRT